MILDAVIILAKEMKVEVVMEDAQEVGVAEVGVEEMGDMMAEVGEVGM